MPHHIAIPLSINRIAGMLLLFLLIIPLQAQNGRFSGRIIEKGSDTPLEFVNVIIRDTETNEMKGGAVTDIDGRFDIEDLPLNRPLQATYSAMSYTTLTSPVVRLSASKPLFDAGNVVLSTEAHLLETVTITGQKRTIEYSLDRKYSFYALTASTDEAIRHWRDITGAEYNFYHTDETTLKTIIRSNPGLLLIKDGTVIGKWSHNDLPELDEKSPALEKTEYGTMTGHSAMTKISRILLWYILPLVLLSLADRTWQFTRWIRQKEHSNKIYQLLKGKKKNEKENCSR